MKLNQASGSARTTKSTIGLRIQELLEQHNVGLPKIASLTGLTAETIRQIIKGTIKNPGIETLSKIAGAFSLSLFELLGTHDATAHINKKRIKIVDIFDLKKLNFKNMDDLINQSIESTEILYIDESTLNAEFFALTVNASLAEKLTHCGMPMLTEKDLLIFTKPEDYFSNSIVLARCNNESLTLGIVIDVEDKTIWVKSVDIPQKQMVIKIDKNDVVGIVHNVQFTK